MGVYWAKIARMYQRRLGFIKKFKWAQKKGNPLSARRLLGQICIDLSIGTGIYQKVQMGPRKGKVPRALGVYWAKLAPTYQRRLGFIKNFRSVETSGDLPTAWRPIDQNCADLSKGARIYQKVPTRTKKWKSPEQ